jgi:hypothetical protein
MLAVGIAVLDGRIQAAKGKLDAAISLLDEAAKKEDLLAYNEPPDWFYPVRPVLGAVLLKANQTAPAEAVYRADLAKYPNNAWSLFGLIKSLEAQKKTSEVPALEKELASGWLKADFKLASSSF